jgi:hypothetical protein
MSVGRAIWTVALFLLGSTGFAIAGGPQVSSAVDGIAGQGLAIMAGAAITAVGVILTMQCWVMGSLTAVAISLKPSQLTNALGTLDTLARELKEDLFAPIFLTITAMFVPVARAMDVPKVVWPFQVTWLSKTIALNGLAVFAISLSVYTVADILKAMFAIHRQCTIVLKGHIRLVAEGNGDAGCGSASGDSPSR